MTQVTLRVLDGADRGQVFENLEVPITIGREEGNSIQLNDERISRFHIKIQEDQEKLVLTDLESTNGTRVNGEDTQLRILRYGDVVSVGRSVLLFGTRDQIAGRLEGLRADGVGDTDTLNPSGTDADSLSLEFRLGASEDLQSTLHIPLPPELPNQLSAGQTAELSELLEYLHLRARQLVQSGTVDEGQGDEGQGDNEHGEVRISLAQWQDLLDMQSQLAEYLRTIGDPGAEG